jgi:putative tricarboxylic transport membrane protein
MLTVALGAVYLALVPVLGFYLASALIALFLPLALGFRRPVYSAITALIFIATVWVVFSLILEKPLPSGFWSSY